MALQNITFIRQYELIVCTMKVHMHPIKKYGASKFSLSANQDTVLLMNIHDVIIIHNSVLFWSALDSYQ